MKILIVDDNPYDRELIARRLQREFAGSEIVAVGRKDEFEAILESTELEFDIVVSDYQLGWGTGLDILRTVQHKSANVPVVMVTDTGNEEIAVGAMKSDLSDYVLKRHLNQLPHAIRESMAKRKLQLAYSQMIEELRVSEERYRAISEATSDFAYAVRVEDDGSMTYEWMTDAFPRVTGYTMEDLIAAGGWISIIHPEDHPAAKAHGQRALGGQIDRAEFRIFTKDGDVRWLFNYLKPVLGPGEESVERIIGAAQDITDRKLLEQELRYQASHDSLTSLPNRVSFLNRLNSALEQCQDAGCNLAVLFLDLNNFKLINDSLGHQIGDAFLGKIATRLQHCVPAGSFVARYGGDEFTVLLENVDETEAVTVAKQLISAVQQPVSIEDRELVTAPSIGISLSSGTDEPWALIDRADIALYLAKGADTEPHYVVFEASMHDRAQQRLDLETDLRHALAESEFRVYYQPVIEISTGQICELEALVRWEHPVRGLVSPAEFIPLAELNGMIVPIGRWVLEEACRQLAEWRSRGPDQSDLVISVNLSSRQFQHHSLVAEVQDALAKFELNPESLKLEMTETVLMKETATALAVLGELKSLGVRMALDDFGTGYSSLAYLRQLPVDTVKIDRSFIRDIEESKEDRALVRAMVVASRALQLSVTAEGIETAEHLDLVSRLGCDKAQGFYFSKPLPAHELEPLLYSGALARR